MGDRWDTMRRSAWKSQGRHHRNLIAGIDLAITAFPFVATVALLVGLGFGVRWVGQRIPATTVGLLCLLAAVLVGGTWGTWEYLSLSAARRGPTAARLSLGGATLAFGVGAVYMLAAR